jgi:hypothetical protein
MSEYQWNLIYLKALGSWEVLTVGTKESTMFWVVMPCSLIFTSTRLLFSLVLSFFRGQLKIKMDKGVGWTYWGYYSVDTSDK